MSLPISLDRKDVLNALKHLGYSVAALVVASAISLIATAHVEPQFAVLVPVVHGLLVSLQNDLKNTDKQ